MMKHLFLIASLVTFLMACNNSTVTNSNSSENPETVKKEFKTFKKTYNLCERENPRFDQTKACLEKIKEECPHCGYTFEFKNVEYTSFGSCRDCIVTYTDSTVTKNK